MPLAENPPIFLKISQNSSAFLDMFFRRIKKGAVSVDIGYFKNSLFKLAS
jgi:hypothetical protein